MYDTGGYSKAALVKNHILESIENGLFVPGQRLPGVKRLGGELDVSHAVVQSVIDSLVCEGVLLTVPRGGSYVQDKWQDRVLHTNVTAYLTDRPWCGELERLLRDKLPEMHLTSQFTESMYEIQTTATVQAHHDEYMDLQAVFDECVPNKDDIDLKPFESFYFDGKLVGIPFVYSPRVMFYNPAVLAEAGCPPPEAGWDWDDFVKRIKLLRNRIEPERIIYWTTDPYYWINIVLRCGGTLINPGLADPVRIDSQETVRGLELYRELGQLVNRGLNQTVYADFFEKRNMAFYIGGRDCVARLRKEGWKELGVVPLPGIAGGVDTTMQVTELLCVRKNCVNMAAVRVLLRLLLSKSFQENLARLKYGIPVLKSAAAEGLDSADSQDALFLQEAAKVRRHYNLDSPSLFDMIAKGIRICLESDMDIRPGLAQLANAVRTYMAIKNNSWSLSVYQPEKEVVNV